MSKDIVSYFQRLCEQNGATISAKQTALFTSFMSDERRKEAYENITKLQQTIVKDWKEISGITEVKEKAIRLPNARVGKLYSFAFDLTALDLVDVAYFEIGNLGTTGLEYDSEAQTLSGIPINAGEYRLHFLFRHRLSAEDAPLSVKEVALIVNADPKSLWKDEASDKEDPYWKSDTDNLQQAFVGRTISIASKRGRSHAHEGKFRDDDFQISELKNGWGIIAMADGAGSAKFSRRGSKVACESVNQWFKDSLNEEQWEDLEKAIVTNNSASTPETQKALSQLVLQHMGKAAWNAHTDLAKEATLKEAVLKDFSTTLLFVLLKKFEFGYFITSFWVGDGGIGIYRKTEGDVLVLGTPDGGEFAGQTRFITMPDIFKSADFYSRFSIKTIPDFTTLILMTDGITDPKFGTDANLTRMEKWNELWEDLAGNNDDKASVKLEPNNEQAADELLSWLDFWSPGNHDDRTIAILY